MKNILTENVIEEISKKNSEPGWMKNKRLENWHLFKEMPMPTGREETWRRTDYGSFKIIETIPYIGPLTQTNEYNDDSNYRSKFSHSHENGICGSLVQRNSHTVFNDLEDGLQRKGVIYTDIISAIHRHPDLIKQYLLTDCIKPGDSKFAAVHAACLNGGTFLYIPKGVEVNLPIKASFSMNTHGAGMFYHTLIVAESGSKVTYIEEYNSPFPAAQSISNSAVEIYLDEGAKVNYVGLQNLGTNAHHFINKRAIVEKDASMHWIEGLMGSKLTKSYIETILKASGSNTSMLGTFLANNEQHIDLSTLIHHLAPDTTADLLINGALNGRARSVFQGMIKIAKNAQRTNSYMGNHNLILSGKARADSIPRLEIEADDVHATHGVSIGQVDEEQLFYLMSRGISHKWAQDMIVDGLFEAVLQKIKQDDIRETLRIFIKGMWCI